MSSQLKDKQQQKDNKRELEADDLFNQHLFKTLAYAGAGFGAGLVASVFLKHRKAMTLIGTGTGLAYGANSFMNEFNQFNRFKDYANQGQQSHTLKREDQLATKNWEDFMPKQESLSEQKRYGGSGDDDDKGSKSKSELKNRDNKSTEKKTHETTESRAKSQSKSSSDSLNTTSSGVKESLTSSTAKSSHDKTLDKSSYDFGKGKGDSSKSASSSQESNNSSQQHGGEKSSSHKSAGADHKESEKRSQDQSRNESQKNLSQEKEQQKSSKDFEKNRSSNLESKSDSKGQGQHLQDFKSNKDASKPAPGESERYRGAERNVHSNRKVEHLRDQQNRSEQDRWGSSVKTGNKMKVEHPPENIAGGQFSGVGLTAGSQTNAVIE